MRTLFCGDIVGRSGRDVVVARLPGLRKALDIDFVVANGENAAAGFGITRAICNDLFAAGIDCITGGNHSWDQKEALAFIGTEPRLLRPNNFPPGAPGKGANTFATAKGRKVAVINLMGRLFMDPLDDPFQQIESLLSQNRLAGTCDALIVDFHAEASSEKMAMGHVVDGRASLCVGSHTHTPTADHMILPKGTAYMTDAGMCGDYDSVIGMEKSVPIARFTRKLPTERLSPALGPGTLCAVFVEIDDSTGLAKRVEPVRLGGRLQESLPRAV
jgi:metallophosphoesterase (TIGR00282 family)